MFDLGQDEQAFWKTMNPRRLHALFDARFRVAQNARNTQDAGDRTISAGGKRTRFVDLDIPAGNEKSLVNYFNGR